MVYLIVTFCTQFTDFYRLYRGSKRGPPKKVVIFPQQEFLNSIPPNIELKPPWIFVIIFALFPDLFCLPDMSQKKQYRLLSLVLLFSLTFPAFFQSEEKSRKIPTKEKTIN